MTGVQAPKAPGPPDPDEVHTREDLAAALTMLRTAAGLSVRDVVAATGVPHGTVSGWMSGQHAPVGAYRQGFDCVLVACGVSDEATRARWWQAATRARQARSHRSFDGRPPYQGLQPFEAGDSAWFFGRRELVERAMAELARLAVLARPVADHPTDGTEAAGPGPALMAVIGPSGSGKSSLLRAGLLPAVSQTRPAGPRAEPAGWRAVLMTPGRSPEADLARLVEPRPVVVVIDQFEEVWTEIGSEAERARLLAALHEVAAPGRGCIVVLGLRADFYAPAARRPELQPTLQDHQILVGPMSTDELRQAIVEPARRAGVQVDDGLVGVLLRDLATRNVRAAHDPGALPLLSHALLATWEHSNRRRMTVADYEATGGIAGAIEQAAEHTYESLTPAQREKVPSLFLRMVTVDGETVSRRRLPVAEVLDDDDPAATDVRDVLDAFGNARLLTRHADAVEITHEALITAWPRLDHWIGTGRAGLVIHRRITLAARQWQNSGRDDAALLAPARLAGYREWAALQQHSAQLSRLESEFLQASAEHHRRAQEQAERAERKRRRVARAAVALAVVAALLSVVATGAYLQTRRYRGIAEAARDEARSRQVAARAAEMRNKDAALAGQLALAAYRIAPTVEARSALLDATGIWSPTRILGQPGPMQVRTTADGARLAVADAAGLVRLFALTGTPPQLLSKFEAAQGGRRELYGLAFSPDGRLLAAGGLAAPTVWDVSDPAGPRLLRTLPVTGTTYSLTFTPGGALLAGTEDGSVLAWSADALAGGKATALVAGTGAAVSALAVSHDGTRLAVAGVGERVDLWRLRGLRASGLQSVSTPANRALAVAFSPDDGELSAGTTAGEVRRWRIGGDQPRAVPPLSGFGSYVNAIAYLPDGRRIAAGSSDQTTRIFTRDASPVETLPGPALVVSLDATAERLVSASTDGTIRLWPLPDPVLHDAAATAFQVQTSTDERFLAAATGRGDSVVRVYDLPAGPGVPTLRATLQARGAGDRISGTEALAPSGTMVATGTAAGRIELWSLDGETPRLLSSLTHLPTGSPDLPAQLQSLALSADGRLLASLDAVREQVALFDVSDPTAPVRLPAVLETGAIGLALAFSPDSRQLAVADAADEVRIFDVTDARRPVRTAVLGGFRDDVNAVAFDSEGRWLAAGSGDRTIRLYDLTDPSTPREAALLTGPEAGVYSVAFSPDGSRLAAGSGDERLWLYDLTRPEAPVTVAALEAYGARVNDARFVDRGARVVAAGETGLLRFWRTAPDTAAEEVCRSRGEPVTETEWARYLPGIPYQQLCG